MTQNPVTIEECSAAMPRTYAPRGEAAGPFAVMRDYCALTKPEVNALVLITTVAGFGLASMSSASPFDLAKLFGAAAGTLLLASGTGALNQAIERRYDAQMRRTMRRPVASGRLSKTSASVFGAVLAVAGATWLLVGVNWLAGLLGILGLLIYLLLYTPLKRKTSLCTLVGAFAGAVPPLIGWFAGGGRLDPEAAVLYGILFLWQFPHFMSIAWIYKHDYERAGYRMIPPGSTGKRFLTFWTLLPCAALLALVIVPVLGRGEIFLLPVAGVLGCGLLFYGIRFAIRKTSSAARHLLTASILYVPLTFAVLIFAEKYRLPIH